MTLTSKKLILVVTGLTILLFNPSFNANSGGLLLSDEFLTFNERIDNKNNSKNTNLKQSRTERNKKMLIGTWKLPSVTQKNQEYNFNLTINRSVTYKTDSNFVYKGEMKLSDSSNGKL